MILRRCFFGSLVFVSQCATAVLATWLIFADFPGATAMGLLLIVWGLYQSRALLEYAWRRPQRDRYCQRYASPHSTTAIPTTMSPTRASTF